MGRTDSFFALGGNSIALMKLIAGLSDLKVKAADVFTHPTPASLAGLILNDLHKAERDRICSLLQDGDSEKPAIFCLPPSGGMSICYLDLIRSLNHPGKVYGFTDEKYRVFGKMNLGELEKAEEEMIRSEKQTESARTGLRLSANYDSISAFREAIQPLFRTGDILIGYSQGGSVAHTLEKQLEDSGKYASCVIILDGLPFAAEGQIGTE